MPKNKKTLSVPPSAANIYFAIEALKRSKKMKGYPPGSLNRTILCARCGISEGWLEGNDHERYLSVSSRGYQKANPKVCLQNLDLYDLKILAKTPRSEPMLNPRRGSLEYYVRYPTPESDATEEIDGEGMVLALVRDPTPELLCLALPMREEPNNLIKLLKPFLKKRHAEALKAEKNIGTVVWEKRNKSYFEDILAWRRNIRCFDLDDAGASGNQIVSTIYPDAHSVIEHLKALGRVKAGIAQVKNMIASAEKGIWPPNR